MLLRSTLSKFPLLLAAFCSVLCVAISRPLTVKSCGIVDIPPKKRIVGGHSAQDGAYPWMVSVQEYYGGFDHICGGAILNEHWIVTAAHCLTYPKKPWKYAAYVGIHKLSELHRWQSGEYKISQIIVHEDYDPEQEYSPHHDIALLRTFEPINFAASRGYVNGICLPDIEEDPEGSAIVTGWGDTEYEAHKKKSDVLKTAKVPIVPRETCNEIYDPEPDDDVTEYILDNQICAGADRMDACQADSGGPLIQRNKNGVHTLIGIVSYGINCGGKYPGVYTKVASFRDWLEEKIQK